MVPLGMIQSAGKEMGLSISWEEAVGLLLCVTGKILMGESLKDTISMCFSG